MKEDIPIEKHVLVPQHTILNEEEAIELLTRYNISLSQLPKISRKDPSIKFLDAKTGNIIKIIRKSNTAGKTVYYRMVYD